MHRIAGIGVLMMGLLGGGAVGAEIVLEPVFSELTFDRPLGLYQAPGNMDAWYVVEQPGRVQRITLKGGQAHKSEFIDIRRRVDDGPNEAGLLGMAFDPEFERTHRVYLSYTRAGSPLVSVLSRFLSHDNGITLDAESEQVLLTADQPYGNHNGGNIAFGPDGYLYYGLGDGGSGGDPEQHGQNPDTLLGSLLRLDVAGDTDYAVPADNPFVQKGGRAEVFAYGLRNPWRWSFDRQTGDLWLADVGQGQWEEVNRVTAGGNYGWNLREGRHCYQNRSGDDCKPPAMIDPLTEYSHDEGCSVTGGYVYRGQRIPALAGQYLFADFCSGRIWSFDGSGGRPKQVLLDTRLNITSFGEDHAGELYVLHRGGKIFRFQER